MRLKRLELSGFKSFANKTTFLFEAPITAIVGPNGTGKSNCAEAFRWVLGERSMKSLRVKRGSGEDLIFNGGSRSNTARVNRAGVSLVFDNQDRKFDLDFDEVIVTREVYRDGSNAYLINGSTVRYRDIIELLTAVSLGTSDHFIVNQGDADRILSASQSERRVMIEDALGLRLYQWKIEESEKKLAKTEANLAQVESLRRELAPHLRFLKKQVERVEQADRWRLDLKSRYLEYLTREENYLKSERQKLVEAEASPLAELKDLEGRLSSQNQNESQSALSLDYQTKLKSLESESHSLLSKQNELGRQLGRLEGMMEIKSEALQSVVAEEERSFSYGEVKAFTEAVTIEVTQAESLSDLDSIKSFLTRIRDLVKNFFQSRESGDVNNTKTEELAEIKNQHQSLEKELAILAKRELELQAQKSELNQLLLAESAKTREQEREVYEWRARQSELRATLSVFSSRREKLAIEEENFQRELVEAEVLVGIEIRRYRELFVGDVSDGELRDQQEDRRRQIERIKIKLEDMNVDGGDIMKEYQEATERDDYLGREVADLQQASVTLGRIIAELKQKIDLEFMEGLARVNNHFQEFFSSMFGGGSANLAIIKEKIQRTVSLDEENGDGDEDSTISKLLQSDDNKTSQMKEGIEIKVSLPRKKIRDLEMLSGGERALTSIALLFAMSQVNPPPFLILDETDAALDEANSRKYGEMVENLAKHSQLILITHNRETMSHAGIIYGVTMGGEGMSKLLSIKFDEAVSYAK